MKCPKCGYNSFEYHDVCKKCSNDLTAYKQTHGIQAIVLPREAREALAASRRETVEDAGQVPQGSPVVSDMFSFDLPEEEAAAPAAAQAAERSPFNFDEEPATPDSAPAADVTPFSFDEDSTPEAPSLSEVPSEEVQKTTQAKAEEDAFASLLESAGQAGAGDTSMVSPAAAASAGNAGEFELENFSWEEIPPAAEQAAASTAPETAEPAAGEFDLENFSWDTPSPQGSDSTSTPAPETAVENHGELDLENFSWEETPTTPSGSETPTESDAGNPFDTMDDTTTK